MNEGSHLSFFVKNVYFFLQKQSFFCNRLVDKT